MSEVLANFISIFHSLIILFVLLAPFTKYAPILILHITFCISLLVHWIGNNNACSLTLLECSLRGIQPTQSYTHKFIAPMYDISSTSWSIICYIVTIFLMMLSIFFLYNDQRFSAALSHCKSLDLEGLSLWERIRKYVSCIDMIF